MLGRRLPRQGRLLHQVTRSALLALRHRHPGLEWQYQQSLTTTIAFSIRRRHERRFPWTPHQQAEWRADTTRTRGRPVRARKRAAA